MDNKTPPKVKVGENSNPPFFFHEELEGCANSKVDQNNKEESEIVDVTFRHCSITPG